MKRNRIIAFLAAVLLLLGAGVFASAREWTGEDFTFTLPEEFIYEFGPSTPVEDPSWVKASMGDPAEQLKEYSEMSVIGDFYTEDKSLNFKVMLRESSAAQRIFTLRDMTEEEKQEFLDQLVQAQVEEIKVEKSMLEVNGQPFYRFQIDGVGEEYGSSHELQYGTIINGHTLAFDLIGGPEGITEEEDRLLEGVVRSVQFTSILERPEPDPASMIVVVVLLAVLVLSIIVPLIYIPIRNKRDKRAKAQMAERLRAFHKQYGENAAPGGVRFVNSTDCTREAVREFSRYHAYGKNLAPLVVQGLVCLCAGAVVFLFDVAWWMKLAVGAFIVYFAYRAFSMGSNVEKVQQKVFGRGISSTARYTFYEDGFRVGGIQSASLYPYFQISSVNRHGHYLYLYYGPDNAYIVDQYGFSVGEFQEFSQFIREKVKKEK